MERVGGGRWGEFWRRASCCLQSAAATLGRSTAAHEALFMVDRTRVPVHERLSKNPCWLLPPHHRLHRLNRRRAWVGSRVSSEVQKKAMENGRGSSCVANDERWSLAGATALVTGGTKGIGHAIVEELARFGAAIHTCSRNEAELNKSLKEWGAKNFKVTGSVCDVACRADREKLMEDVKSTFGGKLSILVNNAGTGFVKPMVAVTPDEYSFMMSTNLESAFHLNQLAHPLLKASGAGSIVNVSSLAGIVGIDNITIYGATKAALNQLTRSLACEWAKDNIRTNCVAPGSIRTLSWNRCSRWRSSWRRRRTASRSGAWASRRRCQPWWLSCASLRLATSMAKSSASTVGNLSTATSEPNRKLRRSPPNKTLLWLARWPPSCVYEGYVIPK
ncbi:Tropinone reductase [Musa troglodytarum]|uniref:Tropinone reductase n=1 Tax=Musa troglodytarum TaxID=320322 RepID=A0A9E7JHF2_9LILI|nr:Tropinone reductase [Musa troglodytarum]